MSFPYQLALLGRYSNHRALLTKRLLEQTEQLGLQASQIKIIAESDLAEIDPKAPLVAIFFGYDGATDASHTDIKRLIDDSIAIIPCVDSVSHASSSLPTSIGHINAFVLAEDDKSIGRLVTLVLENFRLLRAERRLFISYKRTESQSVAMQLYESLDKAGFDVFLDTRSVPYGVDFQSVLWHRMADSDVVILLDTPKFRQSNWTQQELSRANATNIQILHLLWPTVKADKSSAFSEFLKLGGRDFKTRAKTGEHARLNELTIEVVVTKAESLRARALAARHRSLVDNFCDQARDSKVKAIAVQPERYISLELDRGEHIAVVPTIGVPRADRYQEIEKALRKDTTEIDKIWLLYDERGILDDWLAHLDWLDEHLPVVSVQVSNCTNKLKGGAK